MAAWYIQPNDISSPLLTFEFRTPAGLSRWKIANYSQNNILSEKPCIVVLNCIAWMNCCVTTPYNVISEANFFYHDISQNGKRYVNIFWHLTKCIEIKGVFSNLIEVLFWNLSYLYDPQEIFSSMYTIQKLCVIINCIVKLVYSFYVTVLQWRKHYTLFFYTYLDR